MKLPSLTNTEALILQLLISKGEMYGLEMVGASEGQLKRGSVYVLLYRMAEKGFVESRQVKNEGDPGMPRRLFRPTGLGASVLKAWELAGLGMVEALT